MKPLIIILTILFTQVVISHAQKRSKKESHAKAATDTIYIPVDLDDCIKQLDRIFDDSSKIKIKEMTESQFSGKMHLSFGMWLRNNWGLWRGSQLSKFFNAKGIYHPDDMSGIILDSYYRYLTGQEIKLDEQIKYYQDYWKKAKTKELERRNQEFASYHISDTVSFYYKNGFASQTQEDKYDNDICIARGIVMAKDEEKYFIRVKLIEDCDEKGIIYYDNKDTYIHNTKTDKLEKPKRRIVTYMKVGEENWFDYNDWEANE